jgi:hypothetical protein
MRQPRKGGEAQAETHGAARCTEDTRIDACVPLVGQFAYLRPVIGSYESEEA